MTGPAVVEGELGGVDRLNAPSRPTLAHRLQYAAYRTFAAGLAAVPERVADLAAAALGRVAYHLVRIRRADVEAHIATAFPDSSPAWRAATARAAYVHLVRETVSTLRLSSIGPAGILERTEMVGLDALRADLEGGRGALVISGHLGNWEIGGAALAVRGIPTSILVNRQRNRLFDAHWTKTRTRLGLRSIAKEDALRLVPESLDDGCVVAVAADQNSGVRGIFVDFFGRRAATAKGPALFALRKSVPVHLAVCVRLPGWPPRYRVEFVPIPHPGPGPPAARVHELTQLHTKLLEERIRTAPEQYLWMHRRWKTRPPDEESDVDQETRSGQEPPPEPPV